MLVLATGIMMNSCEPMSRHLPQFKVTSQVMCSLGAEIEEGKSGGHYRPTEPEAKLQLD